MLDLDILAGGHFYNFVFHSVLLKPHVGLIRFTNSDYPFGILKLFLATRPNLIYM